MSKSRSSLNAQRSQQMGALLSIIIPAHNEEVYIAKCLHALLEQDFDVGPLEVKAYILDRVNNNRLLLSRELKIE